jgi:hypothetical protein
MYSLAPIISRLYFSRYIVFAMYLDTTYIEMHSKIYVSRKGKTTYNLELREYVIGSSSTSLAK